MQKTELNTPPKDLSDILPILQEHEYVCKNNDEFNVINNLVTEHINCKHKAGKIIIFSDYVGVDEKILNGLTHKDKFKCVDISKGTDNEVKDFKNGNYIGLIAPASCFTQGYSFNDVSQVILFNIENSEHWDKEQIQNLINRVYRVDNNHASIDVNIVNVKPKTIH